MYGAELTPRKIDPDIESQGEEEGFSTGEEEKMDLHDINDSSIPSPFASPRTTESQENEPTIGDGNNVYENQQGQVPGQHHQQSHLPGHHPPSHHNRPPKEPYRQSRTPLQSGMPPLPPAHQQLTAPRRQPPVTVGPPQDGHEPPPPGSENVQDYVELQFPVDPRTDIELDKGEASKPRQCEKLDKFESILPAAAEGENTLFSNVSRALGSKSSTTQDPKSSWEDSDSVPCASSRSKAAKVCEVCGDKAKSFHFGGVSCDSCKAFFRRAVQSESHTSFRCAYNGDCALSVATRKTCQACRFKRCLNIGMEKKWVMNDNERSSFQKQRQEKKLKKFKPSQHYDETSHPVLSTPMNSFEPDVADMLKYMSTEDQSEIERLVWKFHQSYIDIPYKVSPCSQSRNSIEIIEMFTTILRRMVYFHKSLTDFCLLSQEDQSTLLRQGVLEMCMLRSALTYDFKNNRWPMQTGNMEFLRNCPVLRVEDMKKLVSPDLYDMQMRFISGIQELQADEPIVTLLTLIVLFSPDRLGLGDLKTVGIVQDKYLRHLKNYTQWRFGPYGSKMYPKLLTKLSDLRQLNDSHNEYNLRLAQREVNQIQEQLSTINLNPYTQWDVVKCDKSKAVGHVDPSPDSENATQVPVVNHETQNQDFEEISQDKLTLGTDRMQMYNMFQNVPQPSMAGILFSQLINQQIPSLVEDSNPITHMSASSQNKIILQQGASKFADLDEGQTHLQTPTIAQHNPSFFNSSVVPGIYEPQILLGESPVENVGSGQQTYSIEYNQGPTASPNPKCYSALKDILESIGKKDPHFLQHMKQSLSSGVLKHFRDSVASVDVITTTQNIHSTPTTSTSVVAPLTTSCQEVESCALDNICMPSNPSISDQIHNILQSFGYPDCDNELDDEVLSCGQDSGPNTDTERPHIFYETETHSRCPFYGEAVVNNQQVDMEDLLNESPSSTKDPQDNETSHSEH